MNRGYADELQRRMGVGRGEENPHLGWYRIRCEQTTPRGRMGVEMTLTGEMLDQGVLTMLPTMARAMEHQMLEESGMVLPTRTWTAWPEAQPVFPTVNTIRL